MSSKKEMTFQLIQRLTKAEKRLFKMNISLFKKSSSYTLIYDFLEKSLAFDEQKFNRYCKKYNIENFDVHVAHLFEKLVNFMIEYRNSYERDAVTVEIDSFIQKAYFYGANGYLNYAVKSWQKAMKLCLTYKRYSKMPEILLGGSYGRTIFGKEDAIISDDAFGDELGLSTVQRMEWTMEKLTDIYMNGMVASELEYTIFVMGSSKERDEKLDSLLNHIPLIKDEDSFIEVINYHLIKRDQAFGASNFPLYIECLNKYLEELPKYCKVGELQIWEEYATNVFKLYETYFWCAPNDFETYAPLFSEKIEKVLEQHKFKPDKRIIETKKQRQNYLNQLRLLSRNFISADIQKHMPAKAVLIPEGRSYYKKQLALCSLQFILIYDYSESDKCHLKLQELKCKTRDDQLLYQEIELLELIKILEKNDTVYLARLIKKIKQKHHREHKVSPIYKLIVDLIKEMRLVSKPARIKIMTEALPKLEELEEQLTHKHLPFSYWLKSRIQ